MQTRIHNNWEAVFSACSVQSGYKEDFGWEVVVESSFETPARQYISRGIETELAVAEWQ
jgi:hypothetical protein